MSPPSLPRRKRAPRWLEVGEGNPEYATTAEEHYRRIYFEVIDMLLVAIRKRFDQKGYQILQKLETLVVQVKRRFVKLQNFMVQIFTKSI